MSRYTTIPYLEKINFVERYRALCHKFNSFDTSMDSYEIATYKEVLDEFGLSYEHSKKEKFLSTTYSLASGHEFTLTFGLWRGKVETILVIRYEGQYIDPAGRFDFIPEKMGYEFDRKKYNLPKFSSVEDLREILYTLMHIIKDLEQAIVEGAGAET